MDPTQIDSRTRITDPGVYTLATDIRSQGAPSVSEPFIRIESDNVVLDGRGHAIIGDGASDTTAVAAAARRRLTDVTVRNLRVVDWETGLLFENVDRATVVDAEIRGNSYGLLFERARQSGVDGSTVRKNLIGVYLSPPREDFEIVDSRVDRNHLRDVLRRRDCDG